MIILSFYCNIFLSFCRNIASQIVRVTRAFRRVLLLYFISCRKIFSESLILLLFL
jgi:hypothetical protein